MSSKAAALLSRIPAIRPINKNLFFIQRYNRSHFYSKVVFNGLFVFLPLALLFNLPYCYLDSHPSLKSYILRTDFTTGEQNVSSIKVKNTSKYI